MLVKNYEIVFPVPGHDVIMSGMSYYVLEKGTGALGLVGEMYLNAHNGAKDTIKKSAQTALHLACF